MPLVSQKLEKLLELLGFRKLISVRKCTIVSKMVSKNFKFAKKTTLNNRNITIVNTKTTV